MDTLPPLPNLNGLTKQDAYKLYLINIETTKQFLEYRKAILVITNQAVDNTIKIKSLLMSLWQNSVKETDAVQVALDAWEDKLGSSQLTQYELQDAARNTTYLNELNRHYHSIREDVKRNLDEATVAWVKQVEQVARYNAKNNDLIAEANKVLVSLNALFK